MPQLRPSPTSGLGRKIAWSQIEDGELVRKFLKDYQKIISKVNYLIENGFNEQMEEFKKELTELKNQVSEFTKSSFDLLKEHYANDLKDLTDKLDKFILYAEDTYMKKTDKIFLHQLDDSLRDLIIGGPSSGNIQIDKDGNIRTVKWRSYFATSNAWLDYNKEVLIHNNENNIITLEDWFGPNYESGDFSNASVELFYYGDIYKFVTESVRLNDEQWFNNAIANIETNRTLSTYVPKSGVDDLTKYPPIPYFGSVSFDPESSLIQFEAGRTVDYMFCFVKYN